MSFRLLQGLGTTEALADVFDDRALIAAMLQFELALARAEARLGVIPAHAVGPIAAAARNPDAFDIAAIEARARSTGTIAIGLVEGLTDKVRELDAPSAGFVHWGATSQDVTDTALVLCLARARPILEHHHQRLVDALRSLSDVHAGTPMLGRTLLQPAPPVTFGLKAAGWYAASMRGWTRVRSGFDEVQVLQFGGASGTLAALGDRGLDVSTELGRELGLALPEAPWHAHRDRLAALLVACGVYVATLGKIAGDVALLMQGEVAEAAEPGGGSSTLPHKRNPAGCAIAIAAAMRVPGLVASFLSGMAQQHERGVGGGHAEGPTVASVVQATGAALSAVQEVIENLSVDPARMRANIDTTQGLVFSERAMMLLAPTIGREAAYTLVENAATRARMHGGRFADALAALPEVTKILTPADLSTLEAPEEYLGMAERLRVQLLATR
ncbi:MAG: adenylosuccinate lyase family protein [Acidobacteriota bacterium]|nr:adenylosuccinate lyase family protein [Acidobacteriota bacterium]